MRYLKSILNFVNEDVNYDVPKWFYVVSKKDYLGKIGSMKLDGIQGISSSVDIINKWFDIRDVMIVMPGDELIKMNNLQQINYTDPDKLVSNNFKMIIRLKQLYNSETPEKIITHGILQNSTAQIENGSNYIKKHKFVEQQKDRYSLMTYLKRNSWSISKYVYNQIKNGYVINNMTDFNKVVYDGINSDYVEEETISNVPYGRTPYAKKDIDYSQLEKILKSCVYYIGNVFKKESEWIIEDKILRVPRGSKLVIKHDVGNYGKKRYDSPGLSSDKLEEVFNQYPDLRRNYEVILVDNRDEAYDRFKNNI